MILKKQPHLDIETIYIMFFEGFLGGIIGRSAYDADTISKTGMYNNGNNMENLPTVGEFTKGGWGTLIHFNGYYPVQLYYGIGGSIQNFYVRMKGSSGWNAWRQISLS